MQLNVIGAEAERERAVRASTAPDTRPLLRTLLRLRHDLIMVGRAAAAPLPQGLQARLIDPLTEVAVAVGDFLRMSGAALLARRLPPRLDNVESALELLCGGNRHGSGGGPDAAPAERGDGAFLRTLLRAGADAAQFARSALLRGGMGAKSRQQFGRERKWKA